MNSSLVLLTLAPPSQLLSPSHARLFLVPLWCLCPTQHTSHEQLHSVPVASAATCKLTVPKWTSPLDFIYLPLDIVS